MNQSQKNIVIVGGSSKSRSTLMIKLMEEKRKKYKYVIAGDNVIVERKHLIDPEVCVIMTSPKHRLFKTKLDNISYVLYSHSRIKKKSKKDPQYSADVFTLVEFVS